MQRENPKNAIPDLPLVAPTPRTTILMIRQCSTYFSPRGTIYRVRVGKIKYRRR